MSDDQEDDLLARSRRILDQAKKTSHEEQVAGLQRRGVIDDRGNVQIPANRPSQQNGAAHPRSSTGSSRE
jgi:hypothetical protein